MTRPTAVPRFHRVVTVPITGPQAALRVLVTPDGLVPALIDYFRVPANRVKSFEWQRKAAEAIGLLYDYFVARPPSAEQLQRHTYLSDFVDALREGTAARDGRDPTGLFWPAMSPEKTVAVLRHATAFSDHCAAVYHVDRLNPLRASTLGERLAYLRALDRRNAHSFFLHLKNARAWAPKSDAEPSVRRLPLQPLETGDAVRVTQAPRPPKIAERAPVHFPMHRFGDLLNIGFRVRRTGAPWEQWNVRDMMIAILQAHGGLRASEPFHLFGRDVTDDARVRGTAVVRLHHPEHGTVEVLDPITGRPERTTRGEYLARRFGRRDRERDHTLDHAGWKGLMLEDGRDLYARVYWFPPEMGAVFWQLYRVYVERVRPIGAPHPYLFCRHRGPRAGGPHRLRQYARNLAAAADKIGLPSGKGAGATTHALRHAYAQAIQAAGLTPKQIQICLHHKSIESQNVYTRPSVREIDRALRAGAARVGDSGASAAATATDFLASLGPLAPRLRT